MLKNRLYLIFLPFSFAVWSKDLQKPTSAIQQTHREARDSQKKINQLDDETKQLIQKYRTTLNRTENIHIYNEQLSSYIKSQKEEILDIRKKN